MNRIFFIKKNAIINKKELKRKWYEVMDLIELYNSSKYTASIENIKNTDNGYKCVLIIPDGMNINKIKENIDIIENYINMKISFQGESILFSNMERS